MEYAKNSFRLTGNEDECKYSCTICTYTKRGQSDHDSQAHELLFTPYESLTIFLTLNNDEIS
ncbi:hypothetical protein KUTeg_022175 [Tegillarca granosa]|uniref:Uncharacterized protein n=1 Tax=Tegillarca granosa TaxID=220873 RepID=A0ABQ9EA12_TEGGR|nr:hypothetical protein KUTeg_022175 [Tegillarca granosa]